MHDSCIAQARSRIGGFAGLGHQVLYEQCFLTCGHHVQCHLAYPSEMMHPHVLGLFGTLALCYHGKAGTNIFFKQTTLHNR